MASPTGCQRPTVYVVSTCSAVRLISSWTVAVESGMNSSRASISIKSLSTISLVLAYSTLFLPPCYCIESKWQLCPQVLDRNEYVTDESKLKTCELHVYSSADVVACLDLLQPIVDKHFVFVGASRIRQHFFSFVQVNCWSGLSVLLQ